jgi:hemolysin activation/secretion protein
MSRAITNVDGAFGTNTSFDGIRAAMIELQKAYRERGYVTVSVGLPQQKLTNATVKVKVTEGRLAAINVTGNRYFSSNNVMRSLPSLQTNMLLNSQVLQRELDNANASRDRQIYPVIGPGPEPDTSELTLKVKDQLPLHARLELNNSRHARHARPAGEFQRPIRQPLGPRTPGRHPIQLHAQLLQKQRPV